MFRSILSSPWSPGARQDLNRATTDSEWALQHMSIFKKLPVHQGCVNTIQWNTAGDLILSGSDDKKLVVTDYINGKVQSQFGTLHKTNIMSAKFLPLTGDRKTVSCSGDGVIIVSDMERCDADSQDVFTCHVGTVYDVATVESQPNTFLSVGEDGTIRWFDLRAKKSCQTPRCKEDVLFTYQSALTSLAVNPVLPHEIVLGTSDSHIYVVDHRKLSTGGSVSPVSSLISKMEVVGLAGRPHQITSVQFSPEGDQVLASFSGEGVYLFDVKDPATFLPMTAPKMEFEELFNGSPDNDSLARRRGRQRHNFKRIRLRGDWSDTGPSAGLDETAPDIGQARPTVHASFMQRMADVLTSMMNRTSQNTASPMSPVGSPIPEPSFLASASNSASASRSAPEGQEDIDCVTYESLGLSEAQSENTDGGGSGAVSDAARPDSGRRLESTFSSFRIRQDSEQSSSGISLPREMMEVEETSKESPMDANDDEDAPFYDMLYQPGAKMKFSGHRNTRTIINEATFWGKQHIMSGSDCGHVFIWNRQSGKVVSVLQADSHVVNRVRPHPYEPVLATAGIDYDVKLWRPAPGIERSFNVEELMARNARMLEETRDTITVPASYMIRMLASLSHLRRQGNNRRNSYETPSDLA